jgi:hypothetical protein
MVFWEGIHGTRASTGDNAYHDLFFGYTGPPDRAKLYPLHEVIAMAQGWENIEGYFTEGNIGKISAVLTSDMGFVESNCMMVLADLMGYLFAQLIMLLFYWSSMCGLASPPPWSFLRSCPLLIGSAKTRCGNPTSTRSRTKVLPKRCWTLPKA